MERTDVLALRRRLNARPVAIAVSQSAAWLDDLKLFAAACLGGLVFFGTYIA